MRQRIIKWLAKRIVFSSEGLERFERLIQLMDDLFIFGLLAFLSGGVILIWILLSIRK